MSEVKTEVSDLKGEELLRQEMALLSRLNDFKKICEENDLDFKDRVQDILYRIADENYD